MHLGNRSIDAPVIAEVAPVQDETLDDGWKRYFLYFCHNRNNSPYRTDVKCSFGSDVEEGAWTDP